MATCGHSYSKDLERTVEHETVVTIKTSDKPQILPFLMLLCTGFCIAITIQTAVLRRQRQENLCSSRLARATQRDLVSEQNHKEQTKHKTQNRFHLS